MGGKDVIAKATQPGDVQYLCTDSSISRSNKITHVAMVADKSKIVHARGTRYGVVTSSINLYAGKVCAVVRYNPACPLRIGMKGWRTLALQKTLIAKGYCISPDGEYGSKTKEAVSAFQRSCGLPVTGEVDPKTMAALDGTTAVSLPAEASATKGEQVEVTGSTVNLRTGPGTDYPIARLAHQGNAFETIDVSQWIPIKLDGKILWISAKYAHVSDSQSA